MVLDMSAATFEAACEVVRQWRLRPHAIIATDLRRAIERLEAAIDAAGAAGQLELAFARKIDHEAWARVLTGDERTEP